MTKSIISLISVFIIPVVLISFGKKEATENKEVDMIQQEFLQSYDLYLKSIEEMSDVVKSQNPTDIKKAYRALRSSFKRTEILLTYFMENEYNLYLNGAPLPKLEPNGTDVHLIHPIGLQVMDELMAEENLDYKDLEELLRKQMKHSLQVKKILAGLKLQKRHVLEACRSSLVRLTSLGLSGFDTPGTGSFLYDAKEVVSTMNSLLSLFKDEMRKEDLEIFRILDELILKIDQEKDKEIVDNLSIIRDYIDPLYKMILDFHLASGIEHADEVKDAKGAMNYYAKSIFSNDFLNLNYFSKVSDLDKSAARISLGEKLFYDPILSSGGKTSCATCHDPKKGFTDGKEKSLSIEQEGEIISRNAPTLLNAIYTRSFFHDLRTEKVDGQIDHVTYNEKEFNTNYIDMSKRLKNYPAYVKLFNEAYSNHENKISRYTITQSVIQYVSSLTGFNSPFDQYMRGETSSIAPEVKRGFNLFMGKGACATCHFVPVFNGTVPPAYKDSESEVLGVLATNDFEHPVLDSDSGRMKNGNITQVHEIYNHSFKTPTVRNIQLTAPYMHNGVHPTLKDVMTFYNKGGGAGLGLEVPHQTLSDAPLDLTEQEQDDIISFMESLVDTTTYKINVAY